MYAILQLFFVVDSKGTVQQKLTEIKDVLDPERDKNFQLWAITSYF
jgi:hypothetical protein